MSYWLMKSEPTTYSIDHQQHDGTMLWEGCRNYQVRNTLRDAMQIGDEAFFYHSNTPPIGIVGRIKITSKAYPDPTQFDPKSPYYDPKATQEKPIWYTRDVMFIEKFNSILTLADIKNHPILQNMQVAKKGQRLSILPVTHEEWNIVVDYFKAS